MDNDLLRIHLIPCANTITISPTEGEWSRKLQETLFIKNHDRAFEKYCSDEDSKQRSGATIRLHNLILGGKFEDIIPSSNEFFFETANQALQIFHEKKSKLKYEILERDQWIYLPCLGSKKGKFVIRVFDFYGQLMMGPHPFYNNNDILDTEKHRIFIIPEKGRNSM